MKEKTLKNTSVFSICAVGVMCAFALVSFLIENLFPPFFIPGARMGISNIFILSAALIFGWRSGLCCLIIKVVLGGIICGNPSAILYGLPAGLLSFLIEMLLLKSGIFSIVAVSAAGAVINNIIQNAVFCIITRSYGLLAYLPYLAILGAVAGITVGLCVWLILKYLPCGIINNLISRNNITDSKGGT